MCHTPQQRGAFCAIPRGGAMPLVSIFRGKAAAASYEFIQKKMYRACYNFKQVPNYTYSYRYIYEKRIRKRNLKIIILIHRKE